MAFWRHERKHGWLKALAKELGLRYHEHGRNKANLPADFILARAKFFHGIPTMRWLIEGKIDNFQLSLFELRRLQDPNTGKTRGYPVTVAQIEALDFELPEFILRPERWRHKIASALGGEDIDFRDSPRFSSRYRLQGKDENAIRNLFTPELCRFFEARPGLIIQSVERKLFCSRPTRTFTPFAVTRARVRALAHATLQLPALLRPRDD